MLKDLEKKFIESEFAFNGIPTRAVDSNGKIIFSQAMYDTKTFLPPINASVLKNIKKPSLIATENGSAAILPLKKRKEFIILGPIISLINKEQHDKSKRRRETFDTYSVEAVSYADTQKLLASLRSFSIMFNREDVDIALMLDNASDSYSGENAVMARFDSRENGTEIDFKKEMELYDAIKTGNVESVKAYDIDDSKYFINNLESTQLISTKYAAVSYMSLAVISALKEGIDSSHIYELAGTFVQKIEMSSTSQQIKPIIKNFLIGITEEISKIHVSPKYSLHVSAAVKYICANTHMSLSVSDLAAYCKCSESYLYREFLKETGMSPSFYIKKTKVEEAKDLIKYSGYSAAEIAAFLGFSSQSHFIQIFKKITGVTPSEYKKRSV